MKRFAGVLPYAFDRYGAVHLLLSREAFGPHKQQWSGFAGGYDKPGEDTLTLACREGYEESMGALGTPDQIRKAIQTFGTRVDVSRGTHYLLPISYDASLPYAFAKARSSLHTDAYHPNLEKDALAWINIEKPLPSSLQIRDGFLNDLLSIQRYLYTHKKEVRRPGIEPGTH